MSEWTKNSEAKVAVIDIKENQRRWIGLYSLTLLTFEDDTL